MLLLIQTFKESLTAAGAGISLVDSVVKSQSMIIGDLHSEFFVIISKESLFRIAPKFLCMPFR